MSGENHTLRPSIAPGHNGPVLEGGGLYPSQCNDGREAMAKVGYSRDHIVGVAAANAVP